jgi:hypothetical protein
MKPTNYHTAVHNDTRNKLSARAGEHPVQPLYADENGTTRFKHNRIVAFLLDAGPFDMNQLAVMEFSREDREQFAQLIGYSLSGFGELSYVRNKTYKRASESAPVVG